MIPDVGLCVGAAVWVLVSAEMEIVGDVSPVL